MLQNIESIPKIGHSLLPSILTCMGLKQGHNLSPLEFNFFIDDIREISDEKCDPPRLFPCIVLSDLLFADDMITMSMSANGMQRCLDNLKSYCDKWHPEVSIKKTKIIVLNKSDKLPKCTIFYHSGQKLDIVQNHKYLISVISCSSPNITAKVKLQEQADKAYFALQKTMLKICYDPKYCLDLFVKSI